MTRMTVKSGSPYEDIIGFARAVRIGTNVAVSGTAPVWPDGTCDEDAEKQALRCFEIIKDALSGLGASIEDVIRTRMYLVAAVDVDAISRAHRAVFSASPPAATMVVVKELLDPRWKVEIEVEAVVAE